MATIKKRNEIIPTNSETINVKPEVDPTDNAVPFLIGNIGLWYYRTFFSHYHSRLKEKPNEPKKEFAIWLQREYKPALESIWENYSEVSENSFGTIGFNEQFKVKTIYPGLVCGIGYEHELGFENEFKLGFSFDHTTGLPYIPGSSVKGTLRSAFRHNSYPKSILEDWVKAIDQPSTEKSYPKELIGMDNGLDANPGGLKDHLIQIIEHTSWENLENQIFEGKPYSCLLYTSPSPRD